MQQSIPTHTTHAASHARHSSFSTHLNPHATLHRYTRRIRTRRNPPPFPTPLASPPIPTAASTELCRVGRVAAATTTGLDWAGVGGITVHMYLLHACLHCICCMHGAIGHMHASLHLHFLRHAAALCRLRPFGRKSLFSGFPQMQVAYMNTYDGYIHWYRVTILSPGYHLYLQYLDPWSRIPWWAARMGARCFPPLPYPPSSVPVQRLLGYETDLGVNAELGFSGVGGGHKRGGLPGTYPLQPLIDT